MALPTRFSALACLHDRRARLLLTIFSAGVGTWLLWWARHRPVHFLYETPSTNADDEDEIDEDAAVENPPDSSEVNLEGGMPDDLPRAEPHARAMAEKGPIYAHLRVYIREAMGLVAADFDWHGVLTSSDPYCVVRIDEWPAERRELEDDDAKAMTSIKAATLEPRWNQVFEFKITAAKPRLRIDVFDKDYLKQSDPLGCLEVDVMAACPPIQGKSVEGWIQLRAPPSASPDARCGALYLGLKWERLDCMGHLLAFVHPARLPPPAFDLDKLYSPLVTSVHTISRQLHIPELTLLRQILSWSDVGLSSVAVFCWILLSANLQYWHALTCWYLAARMVLIHYKVIETVHPTPEEIDEAHLNHVVRTIAHVLPSKVQNVIRKLQPMVKSLSKLLQFCVNVQTFRHPASPYIFALLIIFAFVPPSLAIGLLGVTVLLLSCPWLLGAVRYAVSVGHSRWREKQRRVLSMRVPESWLSEVYLSQRAALNLNGSRSAHVTSTSKAT
mmetsp:Transcript_57906/g.109031  ORF Transcript_57906/g.109031 Transcript_57906/m.109031 type:complete len:500 (-) Transcript_57906:54-1553(-)